MRDFKLRRRFNKLVKDGGAGGGGVMPVRLNQTILDKTWQEIADCFAKGGYAYVIGDTTPGITLIMPIKGISHEDATYAVGVDAGSQTVQLTCLSPDEYPPFNGGGGGNS